MSAEGLEVLETHAQAFSDLGRTLNEALERALKQASEITGRAQEHAIAMVTRAEHRVAEGLRQATVAERRAAAAQTRLLDLETRVDQAQAKLSEIGAHAAEVARLCATLSNPPTPYERLPQSWDLQHTSAPASSEHEESLTGPLAALASLRATVDAEA